MINVNELRIGNLVKIKTSNDANYYPIHAIDGMGLKVILGGVRQCEGWKEEKLLKPILLTEELLLKCGFEKHQWGDATSFYHPLIELDAHFCLKGVDYNIPVKSLHQLQNIYFDLTRKELEITL